MSRSGRLVALNAMVWICLTTMAPGRKAEATGCHGPDRPTMGLSFPTGREDLKYAATSPVPDRRPHQLNPSPCPADSLPGPSTRHLPVLSFVLASDEVPPPIALVGDHPESPGLFRSLSTRSAPDRPPRISSLVFLGA